MFAEQVSLSDLRKGSKVIVRGGFGNEAPKTVTVTDFAEDIKNGRPGIDYVEADGTSRWAYMYQVERVVKY